MRTLHQLYKLVLKEYKDHGYYKQPKDIVTQLVFDRKIEYPEEKLLRDHLELNIPSPTLHKEFYTHYTYTKYHSRIKNGPRNGWCTGLDGRLKMRMYIRKMISITRHAG